LPGVEEDLVAYPLAETYRLRILALFPAAFLGLLALAFCAPAIEGRPILVPIVVILLAASVILLLLTAISRLTIDPHVLAVRFVSIRTTRLRWDRIVSARYGLSFPSLALGVTLTEVSGRRVRVAFGYWANERRMLDTFAAQLDAVRPEMDAPTTQIVAEILRGDSRDEETAQGQDSRLMDGVTRRARRNPVELGGTGRAWLAAPWLAYGLVVTIIGANLGSREVSLVAAVPAFAIGAALGAISHSSAIARARFSAVATLLLAVGPYLVLAPVLGPASATYVVGFVGVLLVGWTNDRMQA
jgi:hypothetical protein